MQSVIIYILWILMEIVDCRDCSFRLGSIGIISGPPTHTEWSRAVVGAWKLAINNYENGRLYDMNYMSSHIESLAIGSNVSKCTFSMDIHDSNYGGGDWLFAIKHAVTEMFDITQLYSDNNHSLNIPIILGPGWSAMGIPSNPLIDSFNMIQISAGATSTILSGYNSFFRTISTDSVAAKALVLLCKHFNWDRIGIIYLNNDYGPIVLSEIVAFSEEYNISTESFGYVYADNITMSNAIKNAKKSNIYIFVLIVTADDRDSFIHEIEKNDMISYPYYYIGGGAIFVGNGLNQDTLHVFGGLIGPCPWSPSIDDVFESQYPFPVNISAKMYKIYYDLWTNMTSSSSATLRDFFYNITEPEFYSIYAYDAALAMIKAIDKYIELNNILNIDEFESMIDIDITKFGTDFKNILKDIWFIGLSGNVSFYDSGDRKGGLNAYCNIDPETGIFNKIGFIIDDINNELIINEDSIKWPLQFANKGIIPLTVYIEYPGIATYSSLPTVIWFISFLSISIALFYIFCLCYYREKKIIRASQWKLSIIMVCGAIIAYITLVIYGIDESFPFNDINLENPWNWSILCNVRIILLNIAFSFVFGPLLCKVYRIRKLFAIKLGSVSLSAQRIIFYNLMYVLIELIIIIIIMTIIPNNRIYVESINSNNNINGFIEYYGTCSSHYSVVYCIFLFIPKLIAAIYCVIISISAYSTVSIMKYNEGLQIIFVVLLSTLLIIITTSILYSTNINDSSSALFFYGFLSLMLLMISNFVISIMLLPRFIAIWKGIDEIYESDKIKKMNKIQNFMKEMREKLVNDQQSDKSEKSEKSEKSDKSKKSDTTDTDIELNIYNITKKQ